MNAGKKLDKDVKNKDKKRNGTNRLARKVREADK